MKKIIYLTIILISFSCKKDDDSSTALSKIDSIFETSVDAHGFPNDSVTYNYSYNAKGDITEIYASYLKLGLTVRTEYKYINTSLIKQIVSNSNTIANISDTTYIVLDSKGLATQYYFLLSSVLDYNFYFEEYKYDNNNQKIESKQYVGKSLTDYSGLSAGASYILADGNTNTIIATNYENGHPVNPNTTEYTFFTENKNTIGNANKGMSFYGASNVNPTRGQFNTNGSSTEHTYEYDNQNRIIKQTIHQESSISKAYIYYTYTYK